MTTTTAHSFTPTVLAERRRQAVDAVLADVRRLTAQGTPDRAALSAITARLEQLAAHKDLFSRTDFPPPDETAGVGASTRYRLNPEDGDGGLALYLNSINPGKTTAPHDHTTWAVIVAVEGQEVNRLDPRWKTRLAAQARALGELADASLLDADGRWLDYGCGDGALADLAAGNGLTLLKHDEYMAAGDDYLPKAALKPHAFDFVITTSVFEHLTRRNQWDAIEALVAPAGALGISTLVAERVPSDPAWFYLEPPHCAFLPI